MPRRGGQVECEDTCPPENRAWLVKGDGDLGLVTEGKTVMHSCLGW